MAEPKEGSVSITVPRVINGSLALGLIFALIRGSVTYDRVLRYMKDHEADSLRISALEQQIAVINQRLMHQKEILDRLEELSFRVPVPPNP